MRGWRLVLSENGCEPNPAIAALVAELDDDRIEHSPTQAELTGAANSTRLLRYGTAPYVAILHDDDWWDPEFLERRVDFLEQHADCAYVFGGNRLVDEHDREFGRSRPALAHGAHPPEHYVPLLLERQGMPMPPTALLRRSACEAAGATFDERFPAWDYLFYLRLAVRYPVGYLDVWDSAFRVHAQQQTYGERWGERKVVYEDAIAELLEQEAPHLALAPRVRRRRRADAFFSAALDAVESGDRQSALKLLGRGLRVSPAAVANPRLAVVLAVAAGGDALRPRLTRARSLVRRRNYLRGRRPEGRPT
jgi:hypothetical protein